MRCLKLDLVHWCIRMTSRNVEMELRRGVPSRVEVVVNGRSLELLQKVMLLAMMKTHVHLFKENITQPLCERGRIAMVRRGTSTFTPTQKTSVTIPTVAT